MKKMNLSLIATGIVLATQANAFDAHLQGGSEYAFVTAERLMYQPDGGAAPTAAPGAEGFSATPFSLVANATLSHKFNDVAFVGIGVTGKYYLGSPMFALNKDGKRDQIEGNKIKDSELSGHSLTPSLVLGFKPNDKVKLTTNVSIGRFGQMRRGEGEDNKIEEAEYGIGFKKGLGFGAGADFLFNENLTLGAHYSYQHAETNTKYLVSGTDAAGGSKKAQGIATHAIGLNIGYAF